MITDFDVTINTSVVNSGSTNVIRFTITNGSADRIRWLKFTIPNANFSLSGITAAGWTVVSSTSSSITVNGNTINTGISRDFDLTVTAGPYGADSEDWTVEGSDTDAGDNPYAGTGTKSTSITYLGSRTNTAYFRSLR